MSIGVSQFRELNPTAENINALISGSQVIALTVSATDCNLNNYQSSLSGLNTITIDSLNNGDPIGVTSITAKEGYYYYTVVPFPISGSLQGEDCLQTTFNPFVEAVGFTNSDFNILFNNASSSRASNYIQDVDRASGYINPTNIGNVLAGSALKAQVPDSYYTSLAHTSGRYVGSKTSIADYGVSPALGVKAFEGTEYLTSVSSSAICNELLTDRELESFVYTGNFDFPVSGSRIFRVEGNRALPVRDRQIWNRSNARIYTTNGEGYTSNSGYICPS